MGLLATSPIVIFIPRFRVVCHEEISIPIIKLGREGSDLRGCKNLVWFSMERLDFAYCCLTFILPFRWI
jgi:hypothetical protein